MRGMVRLVVVAVLWLLSARLAAQDPAGYRETIDEALGELNAQHYEEARALFARAHELYPNARTLRGLGHAEFELRHYVACIEQLEAALAAREKPLDGALRADTERLVARARTFVGTVEVDAKPAASQLVVDGEARGTGPLLLDAGSHQLEIFSTGFAPERRRVEVRGGALQTLTVVFLREESRHERRRVARSPWLWSAVGLVIAGAAVGTYFALRDPREKAEAPSGGSVGMALGGGK